MLAGVPFGTGLVLLFQALLNYLTDAYEVYAASALAAAACTRSIFGASLPFAAKPMYNALGVHWASTLLALLALVMSAVPFIFIRHGHRIRASSSFWQQLQETKRAHGCHEEMDQIPGLVERPLS